MPGPPPKPTALKHLEGNPGQRRLNEHEPQPAVGMPPKPNNLDQIAEAEWDAMGPLLVRLGVLTAADGTAFETYCTLVARVRHLRNEIAAQPDAMFLKVTIDGSGQEHQEWKPNPLYAMEDRAVKSLLQYLSHFGLTPSMRSKIVVNEAHVKKANGSGSWAA